jgi:hypothetical protein
MEENSHTSYVNSERLLTLFVTLEAHFHTSYINVKRLLTFPSILETFLYFLCKCREIINSSFDTGSKLSYLYVYVISVNRLVISSMKVYMSSSNIRKDVAAK